jgi:hypothetical protein
MRMRAVLHRTLTVAHLFKIFPAFYDPACLLLCSQQWTLATASQQCTLATASQQCTLATASQQCTLATASHSVAKLPFNIVLTAMLMSTK